MDHPSFFSFKILSKKNKFKEENTFLFNMRIETENKNTLERMMSISSAPTPESSISDW